MPLFSENASATDIDKRAPLEALARLEHTLQSNLAGSAMISGGASGTYYALQYPSIVLNSTEDVRAHRAER